MEGLDSNVSANLPAEYTYDAYNIIYCVHRCAEVNTPKHLNILKPKREK